MRAGRLVEALLVLQAREQVTAEELAGELEVSVRTAGATSKGWPWPVSPFTPNRDGAAGGGSSAEHEPT
jgi:hypothetical protein